MGRWSLRAADTTDLTAGELDEIRRLLQGAWADDGERFADEDWEHATGGIHVFLEEDGRIRSHASVVERELHTGSHRLRTGYVEAVATHPADRRRGFATEVMRAVGEHIDRAFELGALDSGLTGFYVPLGWEVWEGPTFVRTESGPVRTAEEDGAVMVRRTPTTPLIDLAAPISCEWRPGDVW